MHRCVDLGSAVTNFSLETFAIQNTTVFFRKPINHCRTLASPWAAQGPLALSPSLLLLARFPSIL